MRINIYSQELLTDAVEFGTEQVEFERKESNTGIVYHAVRMFLHSSHRLHHPPEDDDRSAITWWLPKSADRREVLANTFERLAQMVRTAPPETGLD